MKWLNILGKYMDRQPTGGEKKPGYQHVGGEALVHRDFDDVARKAPRSALAQSLAAAFRAEQTPGFSRSLAHIFPMADPRQRAEILGRLLTIAPGSVRGDLAGLFSVNRDVRPEDTEDLPADLILRVAEEARHKDEGIVDRISDYLADYPTLLKNLDVATLATAMADIGERLAGGRSMSGGGGT